jgi:hypothetical protein
MSIPSCSVPTATGPTERARTLAREAIEQMNSREAEHVNTHRRDVQLQIGYSVLLSTKILRLPVDSTRAKKFASQWIGPFLVVDGIADRRAYRLDLPSHMYLHPTFYVSLLKLVCPRYSAVSYSSRSIAGIISGRA